MEPRKLRSSPATHGRERRHQSQKDGRSRRRKKSGNVAKESHLPAVRLDYTRPPRLDDVLDMSPPSPERQLLHSWKFDDCSPFIYFRDESLTFQTFPILDNTDCKRAKIGFSEGFHVWEIHWPTHRRGTHAIVGVATQAALFDSFGYLSLVGSNDQSWGWNICRSKLYHNSKHNGGVIYPAFLKSDETIFVPDKFLVVLDMDKGTLSFVVDGQYLGVAFQGLRGRKLYPIASATWGHSLVTMQYIGGLDPEPTPLMDLCRRVIRKAIGKDKSEERIAQLNLPRSIREYLLYRDRR